MRSSDRSFKTFTAHVARSGSPNFQFRRVVPRDLRPAFGERTEIRFSLRTADKQVARQRWLLTSFRWNELIILAREVLSMGKIPYVPGMPASLVEALETGSIRKWTLRKDPGSPQVTITLDSEQESLPALVADLQGLLTQHAPAITIEEGDPKGAPSTTASAIPKLSALPAAPPQSGPAPSSTAGAGNALNTPRVEAHDTATGSGESFREVAELYLRDRREHWTEKTYKERRAIVELLDMALGNPPSDRLTHHCDIVETGNESYRFKNRS